jgi:hypothetical protein
VGLSGGDAVDVNEEVADVVPVLVQREVPRRDAALGVVVGAVHVVDGLDVDAAV